MNLSFLLEMHLHFLQITVEVKLPPNSFCIKLSSKKCGICLFFILLYFLFIERT